MTKSKLNRIIAMAQRINDISYKMVELCEDDEIIAGELYSPMNRIASDAMFIEEVAKDRLSRSKGR